MKNLVCKTENLTEKILFQQEAITQLKREIFGTDKKPQSKYIQEYMAEFTDFESLSSYSELLEAARGSRIVYVGDYHALDKCQRFQARLVEDLADGPVLLAVEMLYGRNQRALDDWMAGRIDDDHFRRRVRFDLEWGYTWEEYRAVLEVARRRGIPVYCIDSGPRNDLRYIRKRDTAVATKIADILRRNPDHTLVVGFGESHLASTHLPGKVRGHFPRGTLGRDLIILQNVDEIYWRAACAGAEDAHVLKVSEDIFCVLNATPFEKYEAYRRQLEIWKAQDQDDQQLDLTSTIYNLINAIADFVRIDRYGYCLTNDGVCIEFFIDAYPEVYSRDEFAEFERLLDSGSFTRGQIQRILQHALQNGSCYVPRVNAIYVGKFDLVHGAEEAAHFVNFALKRQRYQHYRPSSLSTMDEFYLTVLEEALGYLGSKIIDPRRNQVLESPILHCQHSGALGPRTHGVTRKQLRWMRRFVLIHKEMEVRYGSMKTLPEIIPRGLQSRGRNFALLTHELGYLLGEQLYRGYVDGLLSRAELADLYCTRFEEEGGPLRAYLDLAERVQAIPDLKSEITIR
jgi:hypothetical protein